MPQAYLWCCSNEVSFTCSTLHYGHGGMQFTCWCLMMYHLREHLYISQFGTHLPAIFSSISYSFWNLLLFLFLFFIWTWAVQYQYVSFTSNRVEFIWGLSILCCCWQLTGSVLNNICSLLRSKHSSIQLRNTILFSILIKH